MEQLNLYLAIFASLAVVLIALLFIKSKSSGSGNENKTRRQRQAAIPNRDQDGQILDVGPRGRRGPGPRMRRRQAQPEAEPEVEHLDEPEVDEDGVEVAAAKVPKNIGAKKAAKLAEKAERKLQVEAEKREREEQKKRLEKAEEERKILEEKEKEEQRKIEEEEQRKREEKERKEYEEYLKLKEAFAVEDEGYDENPEEDQDNKLEIFIQYIKDNKVVVLEDLAAHFKMKTQDTIDRVTTLVKEERLTGVIDDRGKFIYIAQDELEAVAKFIVQRGRVSITDLAENSNKLISLNSSNV